MGCAISCEGTSLARRWTCCSAAPRRSWTSRSSRASTPAETYPGLWSRTAAVASTNLNKTGAFVLQFFWILNQMLIHFPSEGDPPWGRDALA